jgi:hypothetical protein
LTCEVIERSPGIANDAAISCSVDGAHDSDHDWCDIKRVTKKPRRPKREDAAQSAFRALQHVIETTEGKKLAPKRKPR